MKIDTKWRRSAMVSILIVALAAIDAAMVPARQPARAAEQPRVVDIKAKKYEFTPSEVTLKRGEAAVLRLTSEDRTHGFLVKPLKIDADINPGQITEIAVVPDTTGEFVVICDHYCGIGHGNMKMKLRVVESQIHR